MLYYKINNFVAQKWGRLSDFPHSALKILHKCFDDKIYIFIIIKVVFCFIMLTALKVQTPTVELKINLPRITTIRYAFIDTIIDLTHLWVLALHQLLFWLSRTLLYILVFL